MSTNLIIIDEKAHGFLDFGAARVDSVDEARRQAFENYLAEGRQGEMGYLALNLEKRFDPRQLVPGAESVLCFLAPYGAAGGGVAGFAQGIDYHKIVKDRLFAVIEDLRRQFPPFKGRPFVDSAPVLERYWAVKAGLGFIGQNNFFISPEYGLRTIIGVIICNIPAGRFAPEFRHPRLVEQKLAAECRGEREGGGELVCSAPAEPVRKRVFGREL